MRGFMGIRRVTMGGKNEILKKKDLRRMNIESFVAGTKSNLAGSGTELIKYFLTATCPGQVTYKIHLSC